MRELRRPNAAQLDVMGPPFVLRGNGERAGYDLGLCSREAQRRTVPKAYQCTAAWEAIVGGLIIGTVDGATAPCPTAAGTSPRGSSQGRSAHGHHEELQAARQRGKGQRQSQDRALGFESRLSKGSGALICAERKADGAHAPHSYDATAMMWSESSHGSG